LFIFKGNPKKKKHNNKSNSNLNLLTNKFNTYETGIYIILGDLNHINYSSRSGYILHFINTYKLTTKHDNMILLV